MNRNGLVFVPREPPKRVILYPTQDSTSQQQLQQPNGFATRPKTALITNNNHNQTLQQSNNNIHPSRQQPLSGLPSSTSKLADKFDNEGTIPNGSGQLTSVNGGQKVPNPYYANPFFRPKVVTNQPQTTTNINPPPSHDSSIVSTNIALQTVTSASTTTTTINRGRPPVVLRSQNPLVPSNGRAQETEITVDAPPTQEDNRRWAHTVGSAPIVRRTASDERANVIFKSSETNIPNPTNNDALKQKGTSATDIVISLMDTWRAPINPGSSSVTNIFTRTGGVRDDSAIASQTTLATGEQLPNTPPFLTSGAHSTAANNNQNWKKALVANFQKNSRNNPTAKLFTSKQTNVSAQPSTVINNDTTVNQQAKPERTIFFNGMNNERTLQLNENTPSIQLLMRKSTESLRVTKQDNNNNNMERSTSLQMQSTTYSSPTPPTTVNKTEETAKQEEVSNSENTPHVPISIPSALITAKPPVNVDQQRAIITRVMIRRDFVKSTESKPPMPASANFRSVIPPQSAKPGGLPANNIVPVATTTENNNVIHSIGHPNRIYPFQSSQPQSMLLSQKSLLSFTTANSTVREVSKSDTIQQQFNGIMNDGLTSSSIMKMQQSQMVASYGTTSRSTSLSATNTELKRKKEELANKLKKRATSAAPVSNDG